MVCVVRVGGSLWCCAVGCAVTVRCGCCCGSVVVVGTRRGAGDGCCSSSLPRVVLGVVAAVTAAAHPVANLEEDEDVVSTNPVVALVAATCLDEAVEAGNVEDPVAKAQACCCSRRSC